MLDQYVTQGTADALYRFGFKKEAMALRPSGGAGGGGRFGTPGVTAHPDVHAALDAHTAPGGAAGGFMGKAKAFGQGQWGAAKDLFGNLRQGLGGAPDAAAGAAARGAALGNLKTLAPSLLAGGGLYMLHRHNKAKEEAEARQRAMMGGLPGM